LMLVAYTNLPWRSIAIPIGNDPAGLVGHGVATPPMQLKVPSAVLICNAAMSLVLSFAMYRNRPVGSTTACEGPGAENPGSKTVPVFESTPDTGSTV